MSYGYRRFADLVRLADHAYQRDVDDSSLAEIARLLAELPPRRSPSAEQRLVLIGWLKRGVRLSPGANRAANPGRRIRISRDARAELGPASRVIRHGFLLEAVGPRAADAFRLVFGGRATPSSALTPSSDEVARRLAALRIPAGRPGPASIGHIDDVVFGPEPHDHDPGGWIECLVVTEPRTLWDFVQSEHGAPWRKRLVAALDEHPATDRWADRYRLTTADARYRSDLVALHVDRRDEPDDDPARALTLPSLVTDGALMLPLGPEITLPAPSPEWLDLRDVAIQDGGLVTSGDDLVLYESAADPQSDFVSGTWRSLFGSPVSPDVALFARHPVVQPPIPEAVLLGGRNDFNWFHWIVEYLPRVLRIPARVAPDIPVIVSSRTPPTGIDALRTLTERRIEVVESTSSRPVERLHVTAPVVQTLDSTRVPWIDGARLDRTALEALRSAWGVDVPSEAANRRIFLRRQSRRRSMENEHRIADIASDRGFEIVDPAELDFAAQRELYSTTRALVGASGAVMANYLLMRPGGHVIALTSRQLSDFVLPAALATVSGLGFAYVTGTSVVDLHDASDRNEWMHSDFVIDPGDFARALDIQDEWLRGEAPRNLLPD